MATIFMCRKCGGMCILTTTTNDALMPDMVCNWMTEEEESAEWTRIENNTG